MILGPGEEYTGPWLYGSHSDQGFDGLSARFHDHLRARPSHPQRRRPVVLDTWEAVYFDHDLDRRCRGRVRSQSGDQGRRRHRENARTARSGSSPNWWFGLAVWSAAGTVPLTYGCRRLCGSPCR
ncbi:alpha-galactosidase [Streptomyces sp. B21-083]|uniref:alpha-galactosidase n=1 Tax=Streptomyces sp. B21-083 TaxID=3039410 RepID=UPI002FF2CD02